MISGDQRHAIWKALDELSRQHRAFQEAKWALPENDLREIETIAAKFRPEDVVARSRFLFDNQIPDIGTKRSEDVVAYQAEVAETRKRAIREIAASEGVEGVHRLVDTTKEAFLVGWTVGESDTAISEADLLADIDTENQHRVSFALGYARQRFQVGGLAWLDVVLPQLSGRYLAQARVLRMATAFPDAWERAAQLGSDVDSLYWSEFEPIGLGIDFPLVNEVAQQLLKHGRPGAATDILAMYADRASPPPRPRLIADALEALIESRPEEQRRISPYELQHLLEVLRGSTLDEDRLALLEWRLLPGLGYGTPAPTLERRLARDPEFFVQVLSMCFKRADGSSEREPNPVTAQNAFHLLHDWRIVPGSTEPLGEVDESELNAWLGQALRLLAEYDRTEIGSLYIGHSFAHAKEDADGTWPTRPVRDAIERLAKDEIERGFGIQIHNNRGVWTRGLGEGGKQERELAEKFERWEALVRDQWPRTAAVLRAVAQDYRAQAAAEDEEAERFKKGLDPIG